jgi:hypothetical protein
VPYGGRQDARLEPKYIQTTEYHPADQLGSTISRSLDTPHFIIWEGATSGWFCMEHGTHSTTALHTLYICLSLFNSAALPSAILPSRYPSYTREYCTASGYPSYTEQLNSSFHYCGLSSPATLHSYKQTQSPPRCGYSCRAGRSKQPNTPE